MSGEGELPVSVIGAGDTPGSDDHFRPRGHDHYHVDVDAEGHALPTGSERIGTFGEGTVATRQRTLGAATLFRDVRVGGHTPSITE